MSGSNKARKVLPPHLRQADDLDEAWAMHQTARREERAREAAQAARRRAAEDETELPFITGVDAIEFLSDQVFEGRNWSVRSR